MSAERRFQTSYRETDTSQPGLVLEDDGTVWQVKPDGTRVQIGTAGGGSQPDSFLVIRRFAPLTLVHSGGFAGGLVPWDHLDELHGSDISWSGGDAANAIIETDGIYAASCCLFFAKDATSPTAVWTGQIQCVTAWAGNLINPVFQATYSDAGYSDGPTVSAAFPYMKLAAGDKVNAYIDCEGVSADQVLAFAEFCVGRIG